MAVSVATSNCASEASPLLQSLSTNCLFIQKRNITTSFASTEQYGRLMLSKSAGLMNLEKDRCSAQ
jgi:hypothetical protein